MKCNIVSAVLLLLIVTEFSSGRAIPKRGLHEREVDLLNTFKKGRDNGGIAVYGQLNDIKPLRKRVEPIEGEGAGEGADGEGADGEGAQGEGAVGGGPKSGGDEGDDGQEAPNTESSGGEDGQSAPAPAPETGPVVAQVPTGLGPDEMTLWNNLGKTPISVNPGDEVVLWAGDQASKQVELFETEMTTKQPGTAFKDIKTIASGWKGFAKTYRESDNPAQWKLNVITDIKFAEQIANRKEALHIMYSKSDGDNAPSDSFMTMAELGIVTSPNSMVTKIYRWDADTWDQVLDTPSIIWTNGQKPLASAMEDLTNDPNASDADSTTGIFAGDDAGGDAGGDNGSDADCLSCIGIGNCVCL